MRRDIARQRRHLRHQDASAKTGEAGRHQRPLIVPTGDTQTTIDLSLGSATTTNGQQFITNYIDDVIHIPRLLSYRKRNILQKTTSAVISVWLLAIFCCSSNVWDQVDGANVAINNRSVDDWRVVDLANTHEYVPRITKNKHAQVAHDEVSQWWPTNTYYWLAPEVYYTWKIYTYAGDLKFFVNHVVTRGDTSGKYLDEPDLVLEGGSPRHYFKVGYKLPGEDDIKEGYDKNQTIKMPLEEPGWFHLVEVEDPQTRVKQLKLSQDPVSKEDFSLILANLQRSLIRAKYHQDQVEGNLYDVAQNMPHNTSRTGACNDDCVGPLLDDLDAIGLLMDEIKRLAPGLRDGPWRKLAWLTGRANKLSDLLKAYQKLIDLGKSVTDTHGSKLDLETLGDVLELRASDLYSRAPSTADEAHRTRMLAEKTLEDLLLNLWSKIQAIVKRLNEHSYGAGQGANSPAVIEQLVKESEAILRELRNRNLKQYLDDAEREIRRATALLERIKQLLIDPAKSAELLKRLEQLERLLKDFTRIIQNDVLKPTTRANELVLEGKRRYALLLAALREADEHGHDSQAMLDEARRLLDLAKKCLADEAAYLGALPRQLAELNSSLHDIEVKRSLLTSLNPEYKRKYVDKCREHTDALVAKARELDGLFNATRDVADFAMRAANVYRHIIEAIEGAEKAARRAMEAADKAFKVAVPDFDESLADKARASKRKSLELLERAKKLRDQDVERLALELAKRKQTIDQLFEELKMLTGELDAINAGLKQLADKNLQEQLLELDAFLKRLLARIADLHKRLKALGDKIYNSLIPQYNGLLAGSQSSLGNLSQVLDIARKELMAATKYGSNAKESLDKLLHLEAKLDLDVDMLRRKIQLAHQAAGSIRVSLMGSGDSSAPACVRNYYLPVAISALGADSNVISVAGFRIQQLAVVWSLHSEDTDSMLVFLGTRRPGSPSPGGEPGVAGNEVELASSQRTEPEEFLVLEVHDRRVRLVYRLAGYASQNGQDIQVLAHPRLIESNEKGLLSDDTWYYIQVDVTDNGDRLRLSVRPMTGTNQTDPQQVSARLVPSGLASSGASGASRHADGPRASPFGDSDQVNFYVGALPSDFSAPSQIKSSKLAGCLYQLIMNDHQIGLWNFRTSASSCDGCMEGPVEQARDLATFSFTGSQSYASVYLGGAPEAGRASAAATSDGLYDPSRFMVSMSVRTLDANAPIFVGLSESGQTYVAIMMRQGRVAVLIGKQHVASLSSTLFDQAYSRVYNKTTPGGSQHQPPIEHLLISEREYNTGSWFKLMVEKQDTKLTMVLGDANEIREANVDTKLATLALNEFFFGGTWPLVRPHKYASTGLDLRQHLSGCVKDIQYETAPIDLLRRQSYGVEIGCADHAAATNVSAVANMMSAHHTMTLTSRVTRFEYPLPAGRR